MTQTLLEWLLRLAGAILIVLGIAHAFFVRPLAWREELERLSPVNRQVFWVHTYFIVLILLMLGTLSLFYAPLLLEPSSLARLLLGGQVLFWSFRLYAQHFIFKPELWRGQRFNTFVHLLFTGFWTYFILVYGAALVWLRR